MWSVATEMTKFMILSGESTVMVDLLMEDRVLVGIIRSGGSKADCLTHINENF